MIWTQQQRPDSDEGSCCMKPEISHKHEILFCCGFYNLFGNQFLVAMGYPTECVRLEAAWMFLGSEGHDSKTTAYAITSAFINAWMWGFNSLLTKWLQCSGHFGIFQLIQHGVTPVDSVLCQRQPSCIFPPTWNNSREHWQLPINKHPSLSLGFNLGDFDHFLSSPGRLHAVCPWCSHILSSSSSHVGEGYTCKWKEALHRGWDLFNKAF